MDNVSISRIAKLHPKLRSEVAQILLNIHNRGIDIRITQGLRTIKEQDLLYAQGRTLPGKIVTNAKGGHSYHNCGLALDFCLLHKDGTVSFSLIEDLDKDNKADWMEVIEEFKKYGWESGIDWKFKDSPHVQKTFGNSIEKLLITKKDKEGYPII